LAEKLIEKESINLVDIVDTLGERPFPMKESLKEYLTELRGRKAKEEEEKDNEKTEATKDDVVEEKGEEKKEETGEKKK